MRSKLLVGGFAAAIAFLLATNPLVAQAAAFISSADIINNTIKSKDVKNNALKSKDIKDNNLKGSDVRDGSLTSVDLAAGTIPGPQISQFKRLIKPQGLVAMPVTGTRAFFGPTTTVAVDGNDILAVNGVTTVAATTEGDDLSYAVCYRPVGSVATPTPVGGATAEIPIVDLDANENALPFDSSDILAAGSYTVGWCYDPFVAMSLYHSVLNIQVIQSTGPLAKPAAAGGSAVSGADAR